jgi:anti-sigma-K factor RskA
MRYVREQIEAILAQDVERAETVWRWEQNRFAAVVAEIPSGLPHPDGMTRIKVAGERHNRALQDYRKALNEFNAFTIGGIIPDKFNE